MVYLLCYAAGVITQKEHRAIIFSHIIKYIT